MMLTTATQQMNQGETRALYAKLGNLSDPTWRTVGSVTRTAVGVQAVFLPETASFRPLWKACVHGHALLSGISCAWSSAWRVTAVASTRSPVASSRPMLAEKCAGWPSRTRVLGWLHLATRRPPAVPHTCAPTIRAGW